MKLDTIHAKTQTILDDLDLIRNKRIHELDKTPGIAKCATLADRMEKSLNEIVDEYEQLLQQREKFLDEEGFRLLSGLLDGLANEIGNLSKKKPDDLINAFKVAQINRVLEPLKKMMEDEPSASFLDFVAEVGERQDKSRNSYSDVAVLLSQYKQACEKYRVKHFPSFTDLSF